MRPMVIWAAILLPRLQVGALKENSMGLEFGENVLPRTHTWIIHRSSSGSVALFPVKLGIPIFKYLVTSFKWRPKGVSSSGCANLVFISFILKGGKRRGVRNEKRVWSMVYLSGRVLHSACALIPSCSDPTSDGQVSVLRCHPWISNADTTQYFEGFITEEQSHTYYIECLKRELITIIWLKAI